MYTGAAGSVTGLVYSVLERCKMYKDGVKYVDRTGVLCTQEGCTVDKSGVQFAGVVYSVRERCKVYRNGVQCTVAVYCVQGLRKVYRKGVQVTGRIYYRFIQSCIPL